MPRFTYRAKDQTLQLVEGTIEAETESAALSRLGTQGVFPISIIEVGSQGARATASRWLGSRVSQRMLAYVTHQLADLLSGGLPLLSALTLLSKQIDHPVLRRVVEQLASAVRDGRALSDAMAEHPQIFPPLYLSMVKAGEVGGGLEQALTRLAELGEHEAELRSRVYSAAAYPAFVLVVAFMMTLFLIMYVIPKLSLVFIETGQLLPWPTRLLLGLSAVLTRGWWLVGLGLAAGAVALRRWYRSARGKSAIDRTALALPVIGSLIRRIEMSRFTRSLGTMIGQGVPILRALEVVGRNVGNAALGRAVGEMSHAVRDGSSLAAAIGATGQFPVFVSNMVAVGEESGTIDAALMKVALTYEREVDRAVRTLTTVLEPALLVLVGGVVMFIVLAMLLPVFQIGLAVQ